MRWGELLRREADTVGRIVPWITVPSGLSTFAPNCFPKNTSGLSDKRHEYAMYVTQTVTASWILKLLKFMNQVGICSCIYTYTFTCLYMFVCMYLDLNVYI